jgi:hypothetical protein
MEKKEIPPKVLGAAICITRVFTDAITREDQGAGVLSHSAGSCWERVCPDGDKCRAGLGGLSSSF